MKTQRPCFELVSLGAFMAMLSAACGDPSREENTGSTSLLTTAGSSASSGGGSTDGGESATDSNSSGDSNGSSATSGSTSGGNEDDTGILFDIGGPGDFTASAGDSGGSGEGCQFLDILFIVDISGSMKEEKQNLATNFPNFVKVLDDYVADPSKGASGYRLGVTNSSFQSDNSTTGLDGSLYANASCGTAGNPWLDGPAPNISANFSCLANNPKACGNSCSDLGRERPLDTIEYFADKHAPGQPNEGFYRGNQSLLVIVTLTDEDDHSDPTPPSSAKVKLDAFAGGEERYVVVTIAGPQNTGCTSAFGDADAAPRLHQFTNLAPNGLMGDICQGDLAKPLADALELIKVSCDTLPPPEG